MVRALVTLVLACALGALPSTALAQSTRLPAASPWCQHEGETHWLARRPPQNALARITVHVACAQGSVQQVRIKAETRCGRVFCDWNYAERASVDGPALEAIFVTFTATRLMRAQLSGDQISVVVENSYNQPGRADDSLQAILWFSP